MSIKYKDSPFNYDLPVIPLNSSGVCKSGLSLEMKRRYPNAALQYRRVCISGEFVSGSLYIHEDKDGFGNIHQMIWAGIGDNKLYDIEKVLKNIAQIPKVDDNITELALGGFKKLYPVWGDIKFMMKKYLIDIGAEVIIVENDIISEQYGNISFRDAWRKK